MVRGCHAWGEASSGSGGEDGYSSGSGGFAKLSLRVCGFDPTRGVSITVNIGTAAVLYTLHDTFDPLSLRGSSLEGQA